MSIDLDALVQTMRITAGHTAPVLLMPHEARALVAEVERLRAEVGKERAAVVAFLRGSDDDVVADYGDDIERGDHHREEKP